MKKKVLFLHVNVSVDYAVRAKPTSHIVHYLNVFNLLETRCLKATLRYQRTDNIRNMLPIL